MPASNPGQAGSLGAHAETNRAVWSARARGSQALVPWLTSKIYETVEQSVAEPAACWGKARPLQPPAQPYAREYHNGGILAESADYTYIKRPCLSSSHAFSTMIHPP